jgi:site-specific recombinase XerD
MNIRIIYDRNKRATNKKAAPVVIEVYHKRERRFIHTEVSVPTTQWSARSMCVVNSFEADIMNKRIEDVKRRVEKTASEVLNINNGEFSFVDFDRLFGRGGERELSFIEFMAKRIDERADIRDTTKKTQRKNLTMLQEFGKIVYFQDLTKANVMDFDNFLRKQGLKQTTINTYHKINKIYINDAIAREIITTNPYTGYKIARGKGEEGRWLDEEELDAIRNVVLPTDSLRQVRDLFVFQCLTGLAYADLMTVDFTLTEEHKGVTYVSAKRQKTDVRFTCVLVDEALEILERYKYKLPVITNTKYNLYLKAVASHAGIDKPIASHWGRRTCGMVLLNKGISIEVVAKVLGHSSIRITESVYAKVLDKSVAEAFVGMRK